MDGLARGSARPRGHRGCHGRPHVPHARRRCGGRLGRRSFRRWTTRAGGRRGAGLGRPAGHRASVDEAPAHRQGSRDHGNRRPGRSVSLRPRPRDPSGGRVKLSGETWSARTLSDDIEPGEEVVVDSIDAPRPSSAGRTSSAADPLTSGATPDTQQTSHTRTVHSDRPTNRILGERSTHREKVEKVVDPLLIIPLLIVLVVIIVLVRTVRIVPQQTAQIVERLGGYNKTLTAGIHFLIPFVDKVRANIDLREQVVTFPPQPVITSDNLVVNINTVIYYSVTDAKAAVYEIANFIQGIEQLTVTTLRNVIGSLDLEQALTSRDQINGQLRGVLDEATGNWGIRVNRVKSRRSTRPTPCRRRWRSRCAPSVTAAPRSSRPRASSSRRSSRPRARSRARSCAPRARRRPASSRRRVRHAPSSRSSQRSTAASPRRSCWPTSTSRCCPSSPAVTPTRCGSSRPS